MAKENSNRWTSGPMILLYIVLAVVVIGGGSFIHTQNRLSTMRQACRAQYSQVQSVMQRRYDLISNMVNAVKGDMKQERAIFDDLAKARSAYSSAKTANDQLKADDKINKQTNLMINAVQERYPKLASDKRVHDLMVELEGSENRISVERRKYILDVQDYNSALGRFPGSFVAKQSGFKEIPYYHADKNAQKAPKVDLGQKYIDQKAID